MPEYMRHTTVKHEIVLEDWEFKLLEIALRIEWTRLRTVMPDTVEADKLYEVISGMGMTI